MSWVMVRLSSQDISEMQAFKLQEQFTAIFIVAQAPSDAAMFASRDISGNTYCYFSPKAAEIFAKMLPAWAPVECSAPRRESVSLLAGHADALSMLPAS